MFLCQMSSPELLHALLQTCRRISHQPAKPKEWWLHSGLGYDASEFFSVLEGGSFSNPESHGVKFMTLNVLLDLNPSSLSTKGENSSYC